jgi:hypothetical protein
MWPADLPLPAGRPEGDNAWQPGQPFSIDVTYGQARQNASWPTG